MFKASLLCLTAEPLCVHSLKFQVHFLYFEGGLSIGIWRKSGLCPRCEGALPFPSMPAFARAVHSSSNSVVLWVSSSARQTNLPLAEHLQAKFFMFSCVWMLPNCTGKMGTGDYLCIAMSGGAPWGFRLQGGKEQKQPLQIAKVGAWQNRVLWARVTAPLFLNNPPCFHGNGWCGSCCDACLNLLTCFVEILQVLILLFSIKRDYYFLEAC